ncbi:MAG: hypothetical protein CMJ27_10025 [Phycisphaerae bacterium]|nr:hypothetical protein [Phycisphaerae bacterium]
MEPPRTMPPIDEIIPRIEKIRRTMRRTVVERHASTIVSVVVASIVFVAVADWLLRFPSGLRWVILVAGLVAIGWAVSSRLWPAFRFHPSLVDVALRIERMAPSLAGRLASCVEFESSGSGDGNALAARSVRDLRTRIATIRFEDVIDPTLAHRLLGVAVVICIATVALVAWRPADASIAGRRVFAPWSDAKWPARTEIVDRVEPELVHPRGEPLAMTAELVRGDPASDRVFLQIRRIEDGEATEWQRLVLTRQQETRFERIIDTDADEIQYAFETDDDETPIRSIRILPAPAVRSAVAVVGPPEYATGRGEVRSDLGPGTDRRSRLGETVLEGSDLELDLVLERPVPIERTASGEIDPDFVARTISLPGEGSVVLDVDAEDPLRWKLSTRLDRGGDLEIMLRDEYGLENLDPIRYRFDTIADRGPTTTITRPAMDQTVSIDAVVDVRAEARDDVGLASFQVDATLVRNGVGSRVETIGSMTPAEDPAAMTADVTLDIGFEVAAVEPEVGDEILLVAIANDEFLDGGSPRVPVRSSTRRLRIVSNIELLEQLQSALGSIRRSAIRLDEDQARIADAVRREGVDRASIREQDRLSDRIGSAREAIESIEARRGSNRLEDELLADILDQALNLVEAAEAASDRAVSALDRVDRENQGDNASSTNEGETASEDDGERMPEGERPASEGESDRDEATGTLAGADAAASVSNEGSEADAGGARPDSEPRSDRGGESGTPSGEQGSTDRPNPGSDPDGPTSGEDSEPETDAERDASEAQEDVREELADLAELLDRGEDAWVVSRKIQEMAEDLAELRERTSDLADETVGRERSELTDEERRELDDIAREQAELADDADELIEELEARGESMDRADPAQAAGLREAAREAREQGLEDQMREAEDRARENQLQQAGEAQQQAAEALDRMQETIEESRKAQVAELQRRIASLVDGIRGLIESSENEIIALARVDGVGDAAGLAERSRALIILNGNTLAVAAEAAAAGPDGDRIARLVQRAGTSQGAAIGDLRARPARLDDARDNQERALSTLREALEIAEDAAEELAEEQAEERRNDLLAAYAEVLEVQVGILAETEGIRIEAGERLGRRSLMTSRRLATDEETLGRRIESIREEFGEITDSLVFSMTHRNLEAWIGSATERLRDGRPDAATIELEILVVEALGGLAAALDQESPDDDPFADAQNGGGGGGDGDGQGGQQADSPPDPLIPPIAELKMLRATQQQILDATRRLDATRGPKSSAGTESRIADLARMQADLHAVATALLQQLQPAPAGVDENVKTDETGETDETEGTKEEAR